MATKYEYTYRYSCYAKQDFSDTLDDYIDYYDITFVLSGSMKYNIDGTDYTVKRGSAILIPHNSHRFRHEVNTPVEFVSMNFFHDKDIPLPVYLHSCITPTLRDIIFLHIKLKEERTSNCFYEKISATLRLIFLILNESVQKRVLNPRVNGILNYISDHYTENITVEDIANSVFLTAPYCCNLIKKELGVTICDLILKERILLAQEYIVEGRKSFQEIAYLCGFNDYSHFSKSFKKFTGVPPSKYKR